MFSIESIIYPWDNSMRYALAILNDVSDEQMMLRPGGNMNHAAWILGHISIYHPIIPALLNGEPFEDAADDPRFGFRGDGPVDDSELYGTKESQIMRYKDGHESVAQALLSATPEQLNRPPSLSRWRDRFPTVAFMLPDLLLYHESMHIGQLSIWRRAAGLPGVQIPDPSFRDGLMG